MNDEIKQQPVTVKRTRGRGRKKKAVEKAEEKPVLINQTEEQIPEVKTIMNKQLNTEAVIEPEIKPEIKQLKTTENENKSIQKEIKIEKYLAICRACLHKWFSTTKLENEKCPECGHRGIERKG